MRILLAVVLLAAGSADAQTPKKKAAPARSTPTQPESNAAAWPIANLTVEGNRLYSMEQIVRLTGLKAGQKAGKPEFEAARDRLLATGAFDSVGYRFAPAPGGSGYNAAFQVVEIAQVFPFRFEGLPVDTQELTKYMREREPLFAERMPATETVLARWTKDIQDYLNAKGHPENIMGKLNAEGVDKLFVIFRPSKLPSVAEVNFTGNQVITTKTLQAAIAPVAVGSLYTEHRFRELLDTSIRPQYEENGRIRVSFPKLTVEPAKNVDGLLVTVEVNEGPVYKLSSVNVSGADPKLAEQGKFKTDEPVNFTEVTNGVDRMKQSLRRKGYINAQATPERRIDENGKKVDVDIHVEPGPQFTFDRLTIEGLDIETEPHIRKLWTMKPGQPFDASYPEFFLAQIREEGLFENLGTTKSSLKTDKEKQTVAVTLFFAGSGKPLPMIGPGSEKRRQPPQ
jgi:outer membrane protein insertion porin family